MESHHEPRQDKARNVEEEVQSLTSDQDAQFEEKHDENYLDTALEDPLVWPDSHDTACPRNDGTSANNWGYEQNSSISLCSIYPNSNSSKPLEIIITNQPIKFLEEFTDHISSHPKVCNTMSDLSMDSTSFDCQYSSDCANSIQIEEPGVLSLCSDKCINNQTESLCMDSNTQPVHGHISGKLIESRHFESVQFNSGISLYCSEEFFSAESEISCDSVYSSMYGSELLDRDGEFVRSTQSFFRSCRSHNLEDNFYSAQSELPEAILQNQSNCIHIMQPESRSSSCFCLKEFDAVPCYGYCKSKLSSQSESSDSGMLEKGPNSVELISSPIKCTEESELAFTEGQRKSSFSTLLESCLSDSLIKYHSSSDSEECGFYGLQEFSHSTQPDAAKEAASLMPKILAQWDREMESISFSHCFSPYDQRQSEMHPVISDQVYNKSDKSHGFVFYKINNTDVFLQAKVTCNENAYDIGNVVHRFTELSIDEKHLKIPEIFSKGIQRPINVQKRTHYWYHMMQLYSTFMMSLSFGGSIKWLFQLQPVMLQALHRLQSFLIYPFTTLNEFFSCASRESPPSAEECMSVEWMRLQTFQNYPSSAKGSPSRIAREGFFFTGQGTQTRCFFCGVSHGEWSYLDNPREVHQRLSPNCPFLNGRQEGHRNIAMLPGGSGDVHRADCNLSLPPSGSDASQSQTLESRSESREVPRASNITYEDDTVRQQQKSGSGETTPRLQSHPLEESAQSEADNRPKFPEHVLLPSRIVTFSHGWPPYLDQTPQQMAAAGFFFTGNQDYTRCYQCGGGLRNWEPGDNPWIEHCRWYPTCPHVQKGKGQRFVNAVLKKQAELLSTQRAESRRKAQYGIGRTDPLETLAAISLLEMGYPRDTVRNSIIILHRQRVPGAEVTALEVLEFIWKEEDIERKRQEEVASRPHHPGDAQTPALPTLMEHLNLGGSPAVTQDAVQQSKSITTSASSINSSAAMMMTSVTMATSSTSGLTPFFSTR
ncbi:hypothetical protein CHS0354_002516 [Potamilus streckersoni]|uniref:Uncharacterized protein n=1 Tax=Potamilus streckersoni TaxID=2493646 RepID=A0AAE0SS10_9BIVA|nr:hypothetical protein CHS0354_002516 [Potamilus streckersoni]